MKKILEALPKPGTIINGRFRVQRGISQSFMSMICLAEDLQTENKAKVVLKFICPNPPVWLKKMLIPLFEKEIAITQMMDHPLIIKAIEAGLHKGAYYLAMPYYPWPKLNDMNALLLSIENRLKIILQLCHALEYVNSKGIIHRDIKPENIFLNAGSDPYSIVLFDFGIAHFIGQKGDIRYDPPPWPNGWGTRFYMPKEQIEYVDTEQMALLDQRVDIYAAGKILQDLLFGACTPVPNQIFDQMVSKIRMKALQYEPSERYQNAGEMAQAIEECIASLQKT